MVHLCREHVTILAFTGKEWCSHCQRIEPELQKLHAAANVNFHFAQFDTKEVENAAVFQQFQISGYPTILFFDPRRSEQNFMRYTGERLESILEACGTNIQTCEKTLIPYPLPATSVRVELVEHQVFVTRAGGNTEEEEEEMERKHDKEVVDLCAECPSVLAFTGRSWCIHCQVAQPALDIWKRKSLTELGFHFHQFDTDDKPVEKNMITPFGITSFPTFLIFDPLRKEFTHVANGTPEIVEREIRVMKHHRQVWTTTANVTLHACEQKQQPTSSQKAETMSMIATIQQQQEEEEEDVVYVVKQEKYLDLELCGQCATIIVFTGSQWCRSCNGLLPELDILKKNQNHGRFHFRHYDRAPDDVMSNEAREAALLCDAFQVRYPTILIFNPFDKFFYEYTGLHNAQEIMRCDLRNARIWPSPCNVRITLTQMKPRVTKVMVTMEQETNWELHMCAKCPTVLLFTLNEQMLQHLLLADGRDGIHVMQFHTHKHGIVIDLFQITQFPSVIVYHPDFHKFFVYRGDFSNIHSIKHAIANNNLLQTPWLTHPRVVLDASV